MSEITPVADDTITVNVMLPVRRQRLRDLLCSAVEGGSNYWAAFTDVTRTANLDYLEVRVTEHEGSGAVPTTRVVTADDLAVGLGRAAMDPRLARHAAAFLGDDDDAETADVILQMTVFGDVVYG